MLTMTSTGMDRWINVEGYHLHYVEVGHGQPVLLIPGAWSTYRAWNPILPFLADSYRLLAVDYVGAGESDKPTAGFRYTVEEQADLLAVMIKQLDLGNVHVVGGSYGGAIALNLAARYPALVNTVVSIEGGVVVPRTLPSSPLERLLKYPVLGDLVILLVKTGLLNTLVLRLVAGKWYPHMTREEKQETLEQLAWNTRSATRVAWYWIGVSPRISKDFAEEAKAIKAPVLYLYGTDTDFTDLIRVNAQFFKTYLPAVRMVGLEGGIHDLAWQKPKAVAALMMDFFGEHAGKGLPI
jgi:pimeloyl-ACP methyl ester carboxylesterase